MSDVLQHLVYRSEWITDDGPPDLKRALSKLPLRQHGGGGGGNEGSTTTSKGNGGFNQPSRDDGRYLRKRGWDRRDDDEKRYPHDKRWNGADGRFHFRGAATLAYAVYFNDYSRRYAGYSGPASDIANNNIPNDDLERRMDRVGPSLVGVRQRETWTVENCAEVAALNVALSYGERIDELFFIAFNLDGTIKDPCGNCVQWIARDSYGWFDRFLTFHQGNRGAL